MAHEENNQRLTGVTIIEENDILCGRGGVPLKHPGNLAYRKMVGANKKLYATCVKEEKLRISRSIVSAIREKNGRFLEREDGKIAKSLNDKDEAGNPVTWRDIGEKKAVEKTSQALREGQPRLKQKIYMQEANGILTGTGSFPDYSHHVGISPNASSTAKQTLQIQQTVPDNFKYLSGGVQVETRGFQSPRSTVFQAQRIPRFTLDSVAEGEQFTTFPMNSLADGDNVQARTESSDSRQDSWGQQDPMPLLYEETAKGTVNENNVFSNDIKNQLMRSLSLEMVDDTKRPSGEFHREPRRSTGSAMSLASLRSELDAFPDEALSLDSGLDAAQCEAEFELLREFDACSMSIGTFDSPVPRSSNPRQSKSRRSTLSTDLGMIFTSTLDTTPAGIHSGTEVSDLLGMGRGNFVDTEMDVIGMRLSSLSRISRLSSRSRMSRISSLSRISMSSVMNDFAPKLNRDTIDTIQTIQSSEYRALMADIDDHEL